MQVVKQRFEVWGTKKSVSEFQFEYLDFQFDYGKFREEIR